jgi:hypothetical protein
MANSYEEQFKKQVIQNNLGFLIKSNSRIDAKVVQSSALKK